MIYLRIYFDSVPGIPANTQGYIDPTEQSLQISDSIHISPTLVRASTKARPRVLLYAGKRQRVDLFFALPPGAGADDLQWFSLKWRVHPDDLRVEEQLTRFDRSDSTPQFGPGFNDDPDSMIAPGFLDDWAWW